MKRHKAETGPSKGYELYEILVMIGIISVGIGVSCLIMVLSGFRPGYYFSLGWGRDADIMRAFSKGPFFNIAFGFILVGGVFFLAGRVLRAVKRRRA